MPIGKEQITGDRLQLAERTGLQRLLEPLRMLVLGEPARHQRVPQDVDDLVAVDVGRAQMRVRVRAVGQILHDTERYIAYRRTRSAQTTATRVIEAKIRAAPGYPPRPSPRPPSPAPRNVPRLIPAAFTLSADPRRSPLRRTSRVVTQAATVAWLAPISAVSSKVSGRVGEK